MLYKPSLEFNSSKLTLGRHRLLLSGWDITELNNPIIYLFRNEVWVDLNVFCLVMVHRILSYTIRSLMVAKHLDS